MTSARWAHWAGRSGSATRAPGAADRAMSNPSCARRSTLSRGLGERSEIEAHGVRIALAPDDPEAEPAVQGAGGLVPVLHAEAQGRPAGGPGLFDAGGEQGTADA